MPLDFNKINIKLHQLWLEDVTQWPDMSRPRVLSPVLSPFSLHFTKGSNPVLSLKHDQISKLTGFSDLVAHAYNACYFGDQDRKVES